MSDRAASCPSASQSSSSPGQVSPRGGADRPAGAEYHDAFYTSDLSLKESDCCGLAQELAERLREVVFGEDVQREWSRGQNVYVTVGAESPDAYPRRILFETDGIDCVAFLESISRAEVTPQGMWFRWDYCIERAD